MSKEDKMEASKVKSALEYFRDTGIEIGSKQIKDICNSTELLNKNGVFRDTSQMVIEIAESEENNPNYMSLAERQPLKKHNHQKLEERQRFLDTAENKCPGIIEFYRNVSMAISIVNNREIINRENGLPIIDKTIWINYRDWLDRYNDQFRKGMRRVIRQDLDYKDGLYIAYQSGDDSLHTADRYELQLLDALGIAKGAWNIGDIVRGDKPRLILCNRVEKLKSHLDISHPAVVQ